MSRKIIITAAVFGLLGVIAGAFGAHGLDPLLTPKQKEVWHTAVQYQFYHVFALLFLSFFNGDARLIKISYYLFGLGIICFSGSLYLLSCADVLGISNMTRVFGPITPLGGLLFIAGWAALALAAFRNK
jgi:uncharacterized membrane protein YgdD (TMEM256/DUF423 family)